MAYIPTFEDIPKSSPVSNGGYQPSLSDIPQDKMQSKFDPGFMEKLAPNILAGLGELGHSLINSPSNIARYAASKGLINPETANSIPRQQDYNYSEMLKIPGTTADQVVQSLAKNSPAFFIPGAGTSSTLLNAASRIAPQAAFGALTNENPLKGAAEFGLGQAALEGLAPIGVLAEKINPIKYAGQVAEKIRGFAKKGLDEANEYYKPVNTKYNEEIITDSPKKYIGLKKNDLAYFRPPAKKAYNDFVETPNFENLHDLQSKMGDQPELSGWRNDIKNKIVDFLSKDPEMLKSYQTGSDIMKNKYYPYVDNDVLRDITEYKKPIKTYDADKLNKALKESSLVDRSNKAVEPIDHPIVGLSKSLESKLNRSDAYQYGVPAAIGALGGHFVDPMLGTIGGATAGSIFGRYGEPQLLRLAQNPAVIKAFENARKGLQGAVRSGVGYNLYNQQ